MQVQQPRSAETALRSCSAVTGPGAVSPTHRCNEQLPCSESPRGGRSANHEEGRLRAGGRNLRKTPPISTIPAASATC